VVFLVSMNVIIISGIAVKVTECTYSNGIASFTYKTSWTVLYVISLFVNFVNVWLYCWVIW